MFTLVLSQTSSAALTFQGRACNGNSICDVIRRCDTSGCVSSFENCQSCGTATRVCPNGVATAPNTCSGSGGTPQCVQATPQCTASQSQATSDPHVILTFNVFTKKNLVINVTPDTQAGLAGSTLNYIMSLENKNPTSLSFQVSSQIPPGWQINIPNEFSIGQNSARQVQFRITSAATASDATYPILVGVFNSELNLFGTVTAQYTVASRGTPGISVDPKSQSGFPGQALLYNVSITNNDPLGFDATTITLRANPPAGFNAVFTPNSLRLDPGATGSVRLDVTSALNATETVYQIGINATSNRLSGFDFVEYKIDFCGNGVCDMNEEGRCSLDCPLDPNFICSGRCERELDDGLAFSASVNVPFDRFIVCSRNSTVAACLQAAGTVNIGPLNLPGLTNTTVSSNCGVGKACICSSNQSDCMARCVDTRGVYYLLADGANDVRSIANYSFACPFVNLPEIVSLRDNFTKARQDYEKAQSALREAANAPNITLQRRSELQPCVDALSSVISTSAEFANYLTQVIAWPGKANTTAARSRVVDVRGTIETTYNSFCRGVTGLLQVDSIDASPAEKGGIVDVSVVVKNVGNVVYNGYVQCELTGGQGEKTTSSGACTTIGGQQFATFGISANATSAGTWTAKCRALGSVAFGCSNTSLHHERTAQFSVSTRDAFVVDVSGTCTDRVVCSVRTSTPGCGICTANGVQCTKIGTINGTDMFECPRRLGNLTLVGSVAATSLCQPVAPTQKTINIQCAGCGDGTIGSGEQCELPLTDNNQLCAQTQTICEGRVFGIRDSLGLCNAACGCSYDRYEFSCTPGQCGAECTDLDSRVITINKTNGICQCVQQCGTACTWNACDCEPGGIPIPITGNPSVIIEHTPQTPTSGTVTLAATGTNFSKMEIYVDGFVVKTCQLLPCSIAATYGPGTHTYFARASNDLRSVTDPTEGSKIFTVPGPGVTQPGQNQTQPGQNQTQPGQNQTQPAPNQTQPGPTVLNTTTIIVDISHSPLSISAQDQVLLTAVAHGPRSFREINIFVDDTLRKTCSNFAPSQPCTFRSSYTSGVHSYHATATDVTNTSGRDPTSGSKSFTVSGPSGAGTNGSGGIGGTGPGPPGQQPQGLGACYAKINSKNCTYNVNTRRYDVSLSAEWDNGTHAHWIIEDNTGPKIYLKNFSHTEPLAAPGVKNVRAVVHDVNDSTLCFVSEEIYCGSGTTTGKDLDITFDVKSVVKTGINEVRILAMPYTTITPARIQSFTDSALSVSNVHVEGNTSLAGISGPLRVQENMSYNVYTITTNLEAGKNISVIYKVDIVSQGDYTLIAVANYSGKIERITKTIKATSCPQSYSVLAAGPSGACLQFTTPCDIPPGWNEVGVCPDDSPPPVQKGDNTLLIIIIVIILVVLAVLAYKYRDRIEEKLQRLRRNPQKRRSDEEIPKFDEDRV